MSGELAVRQASLEWRDVPGYEGHYAVSSAGDVKSLPRFVRVSSWTQFKPGVPLKPGTNPDGYLQVSLSKNGRARTWKVHQLVLLAFGFARPVGGEVRHINGNPADNRLENLRWGSHSENMLDKQRHGTEYWCNKTHCPQGHPYDEANTWINPRGARVCRARQAAYARKWRRMQKEKVA